MAVRVAGEQHRASVVAEQRLRLGIFRSLELLDAPGAQLVEFGGVEARTQHRVGEQLEHQLAVARQELAVDLDRFAARFGIQRAAGAFNGVGERVGVALAGAIGQQVGRQRRGAGMTGGVELGAAAQQQIEGHQRDIVARHQDQLQSIGQRHPLVRRHRHIDRAGRGHAARSRHAGETGHTGQQGNDCHTREPQAQCSAAARGSSTPTVRCCGLNTSRATASTCSAVTLS